MSRIVIDVCKGAIVSLVTNAGERWRRCRSEAESDTPTQETLEPGTIASVGIAPPGLRRIRQFGETVAWKMSWMMRFGRTCCPSVRNAKSVLAHTTSSSSTCGVTESFRVNETPSTLIESVRTKPKVFGGGSVNSRLLLGATNTISTDFARFSDKLLLLAH